MASVINDVVAVFMLKPDDSRLLNQNRTQVWSSRSVLIFLGCVAYLVLVKLIITFFPAAFRSTSQAAVFEWKFLAIWTILGWLGVVLAQKTGFPEPWNGGISNIPRVSLPLAIGILLGILAIATDWLTGWTHFVANKMHLKTIHIDFPASLVIYPGGAIIVNIIYRIFPIPFLLWIISTLLLKKRFQDRVFWILAALLSFIEPIGDFGLKELGFGKMSVVFIEDYVLNFSEMWLFRKLGFLAPILMRIFFYLIWHVLWGYAS
ncbi:MAG TPA: hypothetical protein VLH08_13680 [Acidobacteriota bacterium]|nr:hypothetical protein [Acidobacteriota bacterium]